MGHWPKNLPCIPVGELIEHVLLCHASKQLFSREPQRIAILPKHIATIVGDTEVYLSEFIIAKVMGLVGGLAGHPEITRSILERLPKGLADPMKILQDTRMGKKYLFINQDPLHEIVVEIARRESGRAEINTIHKIDIDELKRLEHKFPVVFSSGENSHVSRIHASR